MIAAPIAALGFASGPYYGGKDDGMMMCPTEMPPPKYTGPIDYSISAYGQSCIETEINCFNRYSPFIPMAMEVESGSVVSFKTRDLWDAPRTEGDMVGGWDMTASGNAVNTPAVEDNFVNGVYGDLGTVHILTGPVGVKGAMPGDKLKIEIMDIKPLNKGFTMADRPLGFMDTVNAPEDYRAWTWWTYHEGSSGAYWTSPMFPDVEVPYEPFPGSIAVMPSEATVAEKLAMHADETTLYGGPAWPLVEDLAVPKAVCGPTGSHKDTCLRTLAGGSYMGNMDTQRMGIGTTIYVECQVEGCGVGTGDVHGAQGDGELSITAIEMESDVIMKLTVVKPGQPGYNVPNMAMYGGNSIKRMSPGEFVSFYGMPEKETGHVPSQYRWATEHAAALVSAKLIPESMSLASQNALAKALIFLMDVGGYTYGEAMILASVTVDIRVAQLVDKPAVGMEAVVDLSVFKGATHAKFMAHLGK